MDPVKQQLHTPQPANSHVQGGGGGGGGYKLNHLIWDHKENFETKSGA